MSDSRAQEDLELWKKWNEGGRKPEDTRMLMQRFSPLLYKKTSQFQNRGMIIPPAAINTEAKKLLLEGLKTYDPNKGASLSTHLFTNMHGINRFVAKHQNIARIPETRIFDIGRMQRTKSVLEENLGREPTAGEIAKRLKMRVKDIETLQKELRRDLRLANFSPDMATRKPSPVRQAILYATHDLDKRDQRVLNELLAGRGVTDIAKKLKTSKATVSRSKARISEKLKKYISEFE